MQQKSNILATFVDMGPPIATTKCRMDLNRSAFKPPNANAYSLQFSSQCDIWKGSEILKRARPPSHAPLDRAILIAN